MSTFIAICFGKGESNNNLAVESLTASLQAGRYLTLVTNRV